MTVTAGSVCVCVFFRPATLVAQVSQVPWLFSGHDDRGGSSMREARGGDGDTWQWSQIRIDGEVGGRSTAQVRSACLGGVSRTESLSDPARAGVSCEHPDKHWPYPQGILVRRIITDVN